MNDPNNDAVATLLDGLRPAAPSDELLRRLAAARPISRIVSPRAKIIAFIPRLSLAAALIALAGALAYKLLPRDSELELADNPTPAPAVSAAGTGVLAASPLQLSQRLLGVQDLGIGRDARQRPVRLMRTQWLDAEIITPPGGAPPIRQQRVREEIVPVVLNTF